MNNTKQGKSGGFRLDRKILIVIGALSVILVFVIIAVLGKNGGKKEKPKPQAPVASDTVTYTVTARFDVDSDSKYFPRLKGPNDMIFRSWDEMYEETDCTVKVVRDTPPYAWTGCSGDLSFPLAKWAGQPDEETVAISSFPGVTIEYSVEDGIRVVSAGETEYSQTDVGRFSFIDLNDDRFPELLIQGHLPSEANDVFYAYDLYRHEEYECRFEGSVDAFGMTEFNGYLVLVTRENTKDESWIQTNCEFAIREGQLLFVERQPDTVVVTQPPKEGTETFCWFDQDRGDAGKARAIRLSEYPDGYFLAEKTYLCFCYDDGRVDYFYSWYNGIVSAYFTDVTGDGKRELFISITADNKSRSLDFFVRNEKTQQFEMDQLWRDEIHLSSFRPDDFVYWTSAGYYTENGTLLVRMMDPQRKDGAEISMEIVEMASVHEYPKAPKDDAEESFKGNYTLLRRSPAGEAFCADLMSLVVLEEYPSMVYKPAFGDIYLDNNGIISYGELFELGSGNNWTAFADLNGDGTREILVSQHCVLDAGTGSVIAELDDEYVFGWYNNEVWVAWEEDHFSESFPLPKRIVGRPVLRNGRIEIIEGEPD